MATAKKWLGPRPAKCDMCGGSIREGWVDARTVQGPWANMCIPCFMEHGVGLGPGLGQKYDANGIKIEG